MLGEETTILSEGTLSLVLIPQPEHSTEPVLTLTVGKAAFPLYKSTVFGTLADDSRTYVFTPDVEGVNKGCVRFCSTCASFNPVNCRDLHLVGCWVCHTGLG